MDDKFINVKYIPDKNVLADIALTMAVTFSICLGLILGAGVFLLLFNS